MGNMLLDKFAAVKLGADDMITESDRAFCSVIEKAYKSATEFCRSLWNNFKEIETLQAELLSNVAGVCSNSFIGKLGYLDSTSIQIELDECHIRFVQIICGYIKSTYHVSIKHDEIYNSLMPRIPDCDDPIKREVEMGRHDEASRGITLTYDGVVQKILERFEGRTLHEQAAYELKKTARFWAWKSISQEYQYELVGRKLSFPNLCKWDDLNKVYIIETPKTLVRCIWHFQTGEFDLPQELQTFMESYYTEAEHQIPCQNVVERIRFSKNGRVELVFCNAENARLFVTEYLKESE